MSTIVMAITGLLLLVVFAFFRLLRGILNSTIFWILATVATVVLFPITAGTSPVIMITLITLRWVLLMRVIDGPSQR